MAALDKVKHEDHDGESRASHLLPQRQFRSLGLALPFGLSAGLELRRESGEANVARRVG